MPARPLVVYPSTGRAFALPARSDIFGLAEFEDAVVRALPAKSALLGAAKGRCGVGNHAAIKTHHAALHLLADAQPAGQIAREDIGDETIFTGIGRGDHFVLGVEYREGRNRPEDFFPGDRCIGSDIAQDRGRVVIARTDRRPAP